MMKNYALLLFVTFLIIFASCNKNDEILFEMKFEEYVEVPAGLNNIETHVYSINNIVSSLDYYLEINDLTIDQVKSIGAGRALIEGAYGDVDYSTFASAIIEVLPVDRSSRYEAFYQDKIPFTPRNDLALFGSLTNLTEVLSQDKYSIDIALRFRRPTSQTTVHKVSYSFVAYRK